MPNLNKYELDLIVQALEFLASNGDKGALENDEIRELANRIVAYVAVQR